MEWGGPGMSDTRFTHDGLIFGRVANDLNSCFVCDIYSFVFPCNVKLHRNNLVMPLLHHSQSVMSMV